MHDGQVNMSFGSPVPSSKTARVRKWLQFARQQHRTNCQVSTATLVNPPRLQRRERFRLAQYVNPYRSCIGQLARESAGTPAMADNANGTGESQFSQEVEQFVRCFAQYGFRSPSAMGG